MSPIELQSIGLIYIFYMFITNTAFRYPIPRNLISPDEQYWLSVGLVMERPWFLVMIHQIRSFTGKDDPESLNTVMVANVADIESLAQQDVNLMPRFDSAQIVTPGKLNGTGDWKMEPLTAVWVASDPSNPGISVEICETLSGKKYVTSVCSTPIEQLSNHKLRFQFPKSKEEKTNRNN